MARGKEAIETRYKDFITQVVETGIVWILDNDEGIAVSTSNEFYDEEGEESGIVLFWSTETDAKNVAVKEWSDYKPEAVDLDVFLEFSIVKISNEDMLMGINWTPAMEGKEIHPVEIALEIIKELEATGKTVEFKHHKDLAEYKEVTTRVAEEIFGDGNE